MPRKPRPSEIKAKAEKQGPSKLDIAKAALEQIADTEQGAHGETTITSVGKAAKVARTALQEID